MNYSSEEEENYQPLPSMWSSPFGLSAEQKLQPWTSPLEDVVNQQETLQTLTRDIHEQPVLQQMGTDGIKAEPAIIQQVTRRTSDVEKTPQSLTRDVHDKFTMQPVWGDSRAETASMQYERPRPSQGVPTLVRDKQPEAVSVVGGRSKSRRPKQAETPSLLLGRNIAAEPTQFQGQQRVDIRQWTDGGERTRKGISLPRAYWQMLVAGKQQIQDVMKRMRQTQNVNEGFSLGGDVYVTIKSPLWLVDIRYWYTSQDGMLKPGRRGISLKFPEFHNLMEYAKEIGKTLDSFQ